MAAIPKRLFLWAVAVLATLGASTLLTVLLILQNPEWKPHFVNLLSRCWRDFTVSSLGSNPLGFIAPYFVPVVGVLVYAVVIFARDGWTAVKEHFQRTITLAVVVGIAAELIVYAPIFIMSTIKTVYSDHHNLVFANGDLRSANGKLHTDNTELAKERDGWKAKAERSTSNPPQQKTVATNTTESIGEIARLADEGGKIQDRFLVSNDTSALQKELNEWDVTVQQFLTAKVGYSYSIQFKNRTGSAMMGCPEGKRADGCGYWQSIQGKKAMLMSIISELRQSH
jgi:hypothetical protein